MKRIFQLIQESISLTNLLKTGIAFLCLIVLIFLTSFLKDEKVQEEKQEHQVEQHQEKKYVSPHVVAKQQSEDILECILNEDVEGLKSLFCLKFQKTHNLDDEIEELFRFITGEIISYDKPFGRMGSGISEKGIGIVKLRIGGHILNVMTNEGKSYRIEFYSHYTYKEDKEYEGVNQIVVKDEQLYEEGFIDNGKCEIGEYLEYDEW